VSTGVVVSLLLLFWLVCTAAVVAMFAGSREGSPYPPAAAEAPDPVEFERSRLLDEVGPAIVAGADLDRARQPMSLVNLTLRLMVDADPELAAMNAKAAALADLYVAPEVDR